MFIASHAINPYHARKLPNRRAVARLICVSSSMVDALTYS
jgi:hypothetical protein